MLFIYSAMIVVLINK